MDVYYTSLMEGHHNIRSWVDEPEPLSKKYLDCFFESKNKNSSLAFGRCPAIRDYVNNVFVITSPTDYELTWDGSDITSLLFNQDFYNKSLIIRDASIGFISYQQPFLHFFAEESVLLEIIPAHFHDSEFARKMLVLPGSYDIGQHFRRLECACKFREKGTIKIKRGDVLYYVRLHTEKSIDLKRFFMTEAMQSLSRSITDLRSTVSGYKPLSFYYNIFKKNNLKKAYLRLIRENLL